MSYETSYGSDRKHFQPDDKRGSWSSTSDFLIAGILLAVRVDFYLKSYLRSTGLGAVGLLLHVIFLALCVVPVNVLQIFMGQFSRSGFVTAFRLSPMFKGIGYVSLFINTISLCEYSSHPVISLLYFVNSFRPSLPWSCDYFNEWWNNRTNEAHICRSAANNLQIENEAENEGTYIIPYFIPSVLYFRSHFIQTGLEYFYKTESTLKISLELSACCIIIWIVIAFILYRCFAIEKLGVFLRCACWTSVILLIVCLLRLSFLPTSRQALLDYLSSSKSWECINVLGNAPLQAMSVFSSGWGCLICLASFNQFRTNVERSSWLITLGQLVIFILFTLTSTCLEVHFNDYISNDNENASHYKYIDNNGNIYLTAASVFASLEWPNFWSLLYYGMLTISYVTLMIMQTYTILVSAFDEFTKMRSHKTTITFCLTGLMALLSLYFCSSLGLFYLSFITDILFTQIVFYLLLLLVVLWIYGRNRFQRDYKFMCKRPYATWKFFVLRFITPFFLLFFLIIATKAIFENRDYTPKAVNIICQTLSVMVWFFIAGYSIVIMIKSTCKRACCPFDWYPVGATERQLYEEELGNAEVTHRLNEIVE